MSEPPVTSPPYTVAIVDNHEAVRVGVVTMLQTHPESFTVVGSHETLHALARSGARPDLLVLDLYLGRDDRSSVPDIPALCSRGTIVVLYTSEEKPVPLRRAVAAGASGLVLKNDGLEPLGVALIDCARGDFACSSLLAQALLTDATLAAALSPREREVLIGIDDGLAHFQVAKRLGIKENTVKAYLKTVREKYMDLGRDVTNTLSLLREATDEGWLDPR